MLYCLLERSPLEKHQEDQKCEHRHLRVQVEKKTMFPKPAVDIRYDGIYHWPEFGDKRSRCRMCSMLSFVYCSKCQIYLCLQKERNCFKQFNDGQFLLIDKLLVHITKQKHILQY